MFGLISRVFPLKGYATRDTPIHHSFT